MTANGVKLPLDDGLELSKILTTGSSLTINIDDNIDTEEPSNLVDFIGAPISSFNQLRELETLDSLGLVKKRIIEKGGGFPINENFTVSIAYSGYWESAQEPFAVQELNKPLVVDLNDNGLLPGLVIAIKSMLVGETSLFLVSYKLLYGELGVPPKIKPKSDCVFYIKLIKSIITPEESEIDFSEPNIFQRVQNKVKMQLNSGLYMYKVKNIPAATSLFNKSVMMLHKCRLADEKEEAVQERLLQKLYFNLSICYNELKQPLKACTACNELHRLNNLWNNSKALFQNAKALRMIGDFREAEKRLTRAMNLAPNSERLNKEYELLQSTKKSCNKSKLVTNELITTKESAFNEFKSEVDKLLIMFKENNELCRLNIPKDLNSDEMKYLREACIKENLFLTVTDDANSINNNVIINNDIESSSLEEISNKFKSNLFLDKIENCNDDIHDIKCINEEPDLITF